MQTTLFTKTSECSADVIGRGAGGSEVGELRISISTKVFEATTISKADDIYIHDMYNCVVA